jgi:hypothetical protein
MFANLDRAEFVALLQKLGSDNEAEVLTAARDLHAKVTVAGVSWDTLLAPDAVADDEEDEAVEAVALQAGDDGDDTVLTAPDADLGELNAAEKAEALSLIESIGRLKIGAATKAELADYKSDLAGGEFSQMDLRYLRALLKRLSK